MPTVRGWACLLVLAGCGSGTGSDGGESESTESGAVESEGTSESSGGVGDTTGTEATGSSDGSSDGSSGTSDGSSSSGGTDSTGTEAFELEVATLLTDEGRLALQCNLPFGVDDCLGLPELDPPCDDEDLDGLVDAWEDVALERLRPLRRLDEAEALVDDAEAVLADVGRVAPRGDDLLMLVMLGYSRDYGSCGGFTAHPGDSERVGVLLVPYADGGPGGVVFDAAYTAAHEGTINDHGQMFEGDELDLLVFDIDPEHGQPRWVVFPSANKHATYASIEICESVSVVPCLDEDCAPDGVPDPEAFDRLPSVANAGEESAPRLTDLARVGYPGDDAWIDQPFCGGLGGPGCSSSVRSKLVVDPFD